jgi:DNA-binding MarR family transcriptional regulator
MSRKNRAKYETLNYIEYAGFASSFEIAEYRGVTHGCQSTLLRRYWKHKLLYRASGEGKEKIYTLSPRGRERLDWLKEQFEFDNDCDTIVLSEVKRCKVHRDESLSDFLKNVKRCRIIRKEKNYIEIERV